LSNRSPKYRVFSTFYNFFETLSSLGGGQSFNSTYYAQTPKVLYCPADSGSLLFTEEGKSRTLGYSANKRLGGLYRASLADIDKYYSPRKFSKCRRPSEIMISDDTQGGSDGANILTARYGAYTEVPCNDNELDAMRDGSKFKNLVEGITRHGDRANYLLADGHAEAIDVRKYGKKEVNILHLADPLLVWPN
jgi:prepilin-type processing-associated H-X9-DG protein